MDLSAVETNIVFVDLVAPAAPGVTPTALVAAIKEEGVLAIATGPARFRLVTHYQVGYIPPLTYTQCICFCFFDFEVLCCIFSFCLF